LQKLAVFLQQYFIVGDNHIVSHDGVIWWCHACESKNMPHPFSFRVFCGGIARFCKFMQVFATFILFCFTCADDL